MRRSPILMYQFAIDIHVSSTAGASAANAGGAVASDSAARPTATQDLIVMLGSSGSYVPASLQRSQCVGAERRRDLLERFALRVDAQCENHSDGDQHQDRGGEVAIKYR